VAMVFSAFLIICGTNYRRYKIFTYFAFPATIFAVLYLGIHWLIDILAGIALALFTYYLAKSFCKSSQTISYGASGAL
jgi:membrane-associated phospholipid phosphatase